MLRKQAQRRRNRGVSCQLIRPKTAGTHEANATDCYATEECIFVPNKGKNYHFQQQPGLMIKIFQVRERTGEVIPT